VEGVNSRAGHIVSRQTRVSTPGTLLLDKLGHCRDRAEQAGVSRPIWLKLSFWVDRHTTLTAAGTSVCEPPVAVGYGKGSAPRL